MKKILLLTTCLLGTLVAADPSGLPTDPAPKYQESTISVGVIPMEIDREHLKRKRGEGEGEAETAVSQPKKPKSKPLGESDYDGYLDLNKPGLFCSDLIMSKKILLHALEYLADASDLLAFYQVNKASRIFLMQQKKLWQSVVFNSHIMPSPLCPFVQTLHVSGCSKLPIFPNLIELYWDDGRTDENGDIREVSDISVLSECPHLKRLALSAFNANQDVDSDTLDLSHLRHLSKLEELSLGYRLFENFDKLPKSIKFLDLEGVRNVPDDFSHLTSLLDVNLQYANAYEDNCASLNGIRQVVLANTAVTNVSALGDVDQLDLSHCTEITDVSALGNVRFLDLSGCTGIPAAQIAELKKTVKYLVLPDGTEHRI